MPKKAKAEPTKQRTRKHVIASQSVNYIEKFIYDEGHTAERVEGDYGYDLEDRNREPRAKVTTVTVRVPVANEMSDTTIGYIRAKKTAIMANFAKVSHHD